MEARTPAQEALLAQLDAALDHPVWPLFLGRRAFVPAVPVRLPDAPPAGPGLRAQGLEEALRSYPWPMARTGEREAPRELRLVIEQDDATSGESRMDVPVSFEPLDRRYQVRFVATTSIERSENQVSGENGKE